jgi:hypothetical protein
VGEESRLIPYPLEIAIVQKMHLWESSVCRDILKPVLGQFAMTDVPNGARLKVGDECSTGQIVASILGQSTKVTVFTTKDNHLRWQYHENKGLIPDDRIPALNEFDSLMTEIKAFVPTHNKTEAYTRLGKALFASLNAKETADSIRNYETVKSFITQSFLLRARFLYTSFALGVAIFSIIFLLIIQRFLSATNDVYFYGAVFGATGAAVSVMQRSRNIELDVQLPDRSLYLQACIRVLLGLIFGLLFIFASKANLVMGTINSDFFGLCVFALVAGFSERMIPDLIGRLEARATADVSTLEPRLTKFSRKR